VSVKLTSPIVQFEYPTILGSRVGPAVAPVIAESMMRPLREAYRTGALWDNGGRVIVLIEDPFEYWETGGVK
jgi:ApbE superfamily uncharacterized protein (UPF0280 family)